MSYYYLENGRIRIDPKKSIRLTHNPGHRIPGQTELVSVSERHNIRPLPLSEPAPGQFCVYMVDTLFCSSVVFGFSRNF